MGTEMTGVAQWRKKGIELYGLGKSITELKFNTNMV